MTTALTHPGIARKMPGEAGVWVFIVGDMMIFSLFFCVFMFYRAENVEMYLQSQLALNQNYGAINTLLLLSSSWFVVLAVEAIRKGLNRQARNFFALGLACGLGFSLVKVVEYSEKVSHGITLTTNEFFTFYYVYTGIHFVHVIIGMGVLTYLIVKARKKTFTAMDMQTFEGGACFWHMVDLLWIVLFPLIYLVK